MGTKGSTRSRPKEDHQVFRAVVVRKVAAIDLNRHSLELRTFAKFHMPRAIPPSTINPQSSVIQRQSRSAGHSTLSALEPVTAQSSRRSAPPISLREWAVALIGATTLAFTAWGFAGVIAWSLHVMLAGGLLTLCLAICPMPVRFNGRDGEHGNTKNLKRLCKSPVFWFGGAFLLYLMIGAANPDAEVVHGEGGWWIETIDPPLASWLPTTVRSGYEPMNAWRVCNMHLAAMTLSFGLWIGITRRKAALFVLWVFLLSGVGMGLVAIIQHVTEAKIVLWTYKSSNKHFWGSFFYRNQGAAYLNLILVACGFLFFYHAIKARMEVRSGGPHFLVFLFLIMTASSVAMALSRGAIIFGGVFILGFLLLLLLFFLHGLMDQRSIWLSLLPLALFLGVGLFSVRYIELSALEKRFSDFDQAIENSSSDTRALLTQTTWKMAQDRLVLGQGAGAFRYVFPIYQREHKELMYIRYDRRKGWVERMVFHYAHNDIVQFLAEYGVIGVTLLMLFLSSQMVTLLRNMADHIYAALILLAGVACGFGHAFFDFIFSSPAYWVALLGFIAVSVRLLSLESKRAGV